MNKGFVFSELGGFPLNQQRLEYMQQAYSDSIAAIVGMIGDAVIVSGCVVNGLNVSDGWIVSGGELLPFMGTSSGVLDTFVIRDTKTALTFADSIQKEVQFYKYAQFGTGVGAIRWDSLQRLKPYKLISNLPTEYTSDVTVSNSEILATSEAVNELYRRHGSEEWYTYIVLAPSTPSPTTIVCPFTAVNARQYQHDVRIIAQEDSNGNDIQIIDTSNWIQSVDVKANNVTKEFTFTITFDRTKIKPNAFANYYMLRCSLIRL